MDILEFFGLENGYDVKWARHTNSKYSLQKAIEDSSIHIIEIDVTLQSSDEVTPICANPPDSKSDLTLLECFDTTWGILQPKYKRIVHQKAFKLNFQSSNAVIIASTQLAFYLLSKSDENAETFSWPPIMLHANVLLGPGINSSNTYTLIDSNEIIEASKRLPFAIVSLGWETGVSAPTTLAGAFNKKRTLDESPKETHYTDSMISEMAEIVKQISSKVQLSFRGCYVVNRSDDDRWWENCVLHTFLGREVVMFDDDGDLIKAGSQDETKCYCEKMKKNSFLLWSNGRDSLDGDKLQQFVLRQSVTTLKSTLNDPKTCDKCGSELFPALRTPCLLLLDLHSKHAGFLDSWEIATYLYEGDGKDTMPNLIMKHVSDKFPNNKRFRYT